MFKRMLIMLIAVAAVGIGVVAFKSFVNGKIKQSITSSFAPPTVSTIKADLQDWQPKLEAVGTLRAINGADLSSELAGIVETIGFDSGSDARAGETLVQLRAEDEIAKLHALEASAKLAEIVFERDQKQLKVQAVSQATVDTDIAGLANAAALVRQQQAIVAKKTIRAPFAGRLGVRQVDVGQYLNPGTPIVTLQQLDPIYADFTLPERALPKIALGQKVRLAADASAGQEFSGEITAINAKVDDATRNITVRATFPNPDRVLLPGMFANVAIDVDQPVRTLTLPQTAVVFNPYGNTVYLVQAKDGAAPGKPQLVAQESVVTTGETRGDQIAVLSGIKEGDEVITSGQIKLRSGTPVIINNAVQPSNDPDPRPHEH